MPEYNNCAHRDERWHCYGDNPIPHASCYLWLLIDLSSQGDKH